MRAHCGCQLGNSELSGGTVEEWADDEGGWPRDTFLVLSCTHWSPCPGVVLCWRLSTSMDVLPGLLGYWSRRRGGACQALLGSLGFSGDGWGFAEAAGQSVGVGVCIARFGGMHRGGGSDVVGGDLRGG